MTKQSNREAVAAAQTNFSIVNYGFEPLTFRSPMFLRYGVREPYEWLSKQDFGSATGGIWQNWVRKNEHGQDYGYATGALVRIRDPGSEYVFSIHQSGRLVTYTTGSENASVYTGTWLFDDFTAYVYLSVGDTSVPQPDGVREPLQGTVLCKGKMLSVPIEAGVPTTPTQKLSKVTFADTEAFSFMSNVNVYFSGADVYASTALGVVPCPRHGSGNPTLGNYYYLTPEAGYPPGMTTLTVKDGFSDTTAIVQFDHDMTRMEVTMTIISYESRVCDIRDISFNGHFPYCICIAL